MVRVRVRVRVRVAVILSWSWVRVRGFSFLSLRLVCSWSCLISHVLSWSWFRVRVRVLVLSVIQANWIFQIYSLQECYFASTLPLALSYLAFFFSCTTSVASANTSANNT
jgi:hypothetical protein